MMAFILKTFLVSYCLHLTNANGYAYQSNVYHNQLPTPHAFAPQQPYFPPLSPPATHNPQWQFQNVGNYPTWIITTTEIETRNETVPSMSSEDKPVGPNLNETTSTLPDDDVKIQLDDLNGSEVGDESDLEFPVKHGKDPAIRAKPAFADEDVKYHSKEDEVEDVTTTEMPSTTEMPIEENTEKEVKSVTVNKTTTVKIQLVQNSPYIPIVLRLSGQTPDAITGKDNSYNALPQNIDPVLPPYSFPPAGYPALPPVPSPQINFPQTQHRVYHPSGSYSTYTGWSKK